MIALRVICVHPSREHAIYEIEDINVLAMLRRQGNHVLPLSGKQGERQASITVNASLYSSGAFVPPQKTRNPLTVDDLKRIGTVNAVLEKHLRLAPPSWPALLSHLQAFVKVTEKMSKLFMHFHIRSQSALQQHERDMRINGLIDTMADLYRCLLDLQSLQKISTAPLRILVGSKRIPGYMELISLLVQRVLENTLSSVDDMIDSYEKVFYNLKIDLLLGSSSQVALVATRILQSLEKLSTAVAHVSNAIDLPMMRGASWSPQLCCIPGTCNDLINGIIEWMVSTTHDQRIYLLLGEKGSGKTSAAHSIARLFDEGKRLGSAVFLEADPARRDPNLLLSTIARELSAFDETLRYEISNVLTQHPALATADIGRQYPELIVGPLSRLTWIGPLLIVIDGVDKCDDRGRFLLLLSKFSSQLPSNVRFLLTSRPESDIEGVFQSNLHCYRYHVSLIPPNGQTLEVVQKWCAENSNIGADSVACLIAKFSSSIPIWGSTAAAFLGQDRDEVKDRFLRKLAMSEPSPDANSAMNDLYSAILDAMFDDRDILLSSVAWRVIIQFMKCSLPLSLGTARMLLVNSIGGEATGLVGLVDMLYVCNCILEKERIISMHPAFERFVTNTMLPTWSQSYSSVIACFQVMTIFFKRGSRLSLLKRATPGGVHSPVRNDGPDEGPCPSMLQYACNQWIGHLLCVKGNTTVDHQLLLETLHQFLHKDLLRWLEIMALLESLDVAYYSLAQLQEWLQGNNVREAPLVMCYDGIRFIQRLSQLIPGTKGSMDKLLPCIPSKTLIFEVYSKEKICHPDLKGESWSPLTHHMIHSERLGYLSFSPDGCTIASCCKNSIVTWDISTGLQIDCYNHPSKVTRVVFSLDGELLAAALISGRVRICGAKDQNVLSVFKGPTKDVDCLAFFPSGGRLAASFALHGCYIIDVKTGSLLSRYGYRWFFDSGSAVSMIISQGRVVLASRTGRNVRIWDGETGRSIGPLFKHDSGVQVASWSPDGQLLATGSRNGDVRVWDIQTGHVVHSCPNSTLAGMIEMIQFSQRGDMLAIGSSSERLVVWKLSKNVPPYQMTGIYLPSRPIAIDWDLNDRIACALENQRIIVWNVGQQTSEVDRGLYSVDFENYRDLGEISIVRRDGTRLFKSKKTRS
ncbi:hypothetical protein AMATHDRAFT_48941 [Amanita thiersii Skay4041]|uniref:NACHT domain-containing protein n=1 Tax=Amanita thiersii Skay4041 TaxID=703135 RepID=A0A2A9NEY6_9AGAR|nr:hypothetical protein AMATHDRAFT_48941 [Amanita thiersii Skay4041]